MIAFLPFAVSLAFAAFVGDTRPAPEPTVRELEAALRATTGDSFGSDGGKPVVVSENQMILPWSEPSPPRPEVDFKPYEMLLRMDIESVPDDLLLGVLLAGATFEDPVEVSRRVLAGVDGNLSRLQEGSVWAETRGVGLMGRARSIAAFEMGRRAALRSHLAVKQPVTTPDEAVAALRLMSFGDYESLSAIFLDRRRRVVGAKTLTRGSDGFTVVDPRQIFRVAIEMGAVAVIMAHNHPSGDPTPSSQDRDVTERVARAGRVIGIPLLDHIVLGANGRYTSLAAEGHLPAWTPPGPSWTQEGASEPDGPPYQPSAAQRPVAVRRSGRLVVSLFGSSDGDRFRAVVEGPSGRWRSVVSRIPTHGSDPVTATDGDQLAVSALVRAEEDGFDVSSAEWRPDGNGFLVTAP